jgi:hypothetical protein
MTDQQPRDCYVCRKPIRISRESCGFRTFPPLRTWHFALRYRAGAMNALPKIGAEGATATQLRARVLAQLNGQASRVENPDLKGKAK